jgi:hypothetical protein
MRRCALRLCGLVLAGLLSVHPANSDDAALPKDRAGLDAYLRDYILANPQVVREALLKLEKE